MLGDQDAGGKAVFDPRESKGKEESISTEGFLFFVFTKKKLCGLCVLCG
jgi:hypothetical protein